MATWDNSQYDQNATDIAKTFCAGQGQNGSNLTDLVEKVARDNSLNGEQIRRLSRTANVKTFGAKFDEMKTAGAEDRNVEFQLADENEVLRRLAGTAEAAVKVAYAAPQADKFPDLSDDYHDVRRPVPELQKTAEELHVAMPRSSPEVEIMKLQRLHEEADMRAKQASTTWHYSLESVMELARKSTWSADKTADLEKTAVALYGVNAVPEINVLRLSRKADKLELTQEKVAAIQDRIVVKETDAVKFVKRAMDARQAWVEYDGAKQLIEKRLLHWTSKLSSDKKPENKPAEKTLKEKGHIVGNVIGTLVPGARLAAQIAPDREEITRFMSGASEGFTHGGGYKKK